MQISCCFLSLYFNYVKHIEIIFRWLIEALKQWGAPNLELSLDIFLLAYPNSAFKKSEVGGIK